MRLALLVVVVVAAFASSCVSSFPPGVFDPGRGAHPLARGDVRLQAGGGAGVSLVGDVGGAAGGRLEVQLTDDLAVGADVGAGAQMNALLPWPVVVSGGYAGAQWNPFGLDFLALRGRLGVGVDVLPFSLLVDEPEAFAAPWVGGLGSVVFSLPTSVELGGLEPFFSLQLGARRYVGVVSDLVGLGPAGITEWLSAGGGTLGLSFDITETVSLYGTGNVTALVLHGTGASRGSLTPALPRTAIIPTGNLQAGIALTF